VGRGWNGPGSPRRPGARCISLGNGHGLTTGNPVQLSAATDSHKHPRGARCQWVGALMALAATCSALPFDTVHVGTVSAPWVAVAFDADQV
jgi:hypothetical protein